MGLLDFRKPEWQHNDAAVRLAAINKLDPKQTDILLSVAQDDPENEIKLAAIKQISDIDTLEILSSSDLNDEVLAVVGLQIDELLCSTILGPAAPEDSTELLARIKNIDIIAIIAVEAEASTLRSAAIERISDQDILASIVKKKCGREPALLALEKINDENLLAELSQKASGKAARRMAGEKLSAIEAASFKPDPAVQKEEQLSELLAATHNLVMAKDWDKAANRLTTLRIDWQSLDLNGEHHLNEEFLEACKTFEERYREICERRKEESEKASKIEKQLARLENICTNIESLIFSTDDDTDKRFNSAVSDWEEAAKEGSFKLVITESLKTRFSKICRSYDQKQEKIRGEKKILSLLEEMLLEAEKLIAKGHSSKARIALDNAGTKIEQEKFKYINIGPIRQRQTELRELFDQKLAETLEKNTIARKNLCEKLEVLLESGKQAKSERKMESIREEWQNLPRSESDEERALEQRFADTLDKFTEKQKAFFHEREWQGWANLNLKEKLLERAENLDQEEDLAMVQEMIKTLQTEWKNTGPLPRDVSQKLWERFHAACDRNYERCQPYREELKKMTKEADKRRDEICIRAEELADSTEWKKTAEELKNLQAEWKDLLRGRRSDEEKQFRRFRTACNSFFEKRNKNYEGQEEKRRENLTRKEELCAEAEQLADEPALDSADKFRDLQNRWKKIGHVPRKKEDAIWKRFRAACDRFFSWIDEQRLENLHQKEELCQRAEEIIAKLTDKSDRKEISGQLTTLQEQWKEIGPIPNDQKDAIWARFNAPCDEFFKAQREHFKKIEAERSKIQELKEDYLSQAEELGGRGIDKETTNLMKDIQKKWNEAGHASREIERELNQRFKATCDSFFEGRRQHFSDLEKERLENLKSRESLCLKLENIIGSSSKSVASGKGKALSLAEELKLAMEENFVMAGRRNDKKAVSDEVNKIQQEWKKVGPVPREHDKSTRQRFKKALDIYYSEKNNKG